jgi:hypothetical protein
MNMNISMDNVGVDEVLVSIEAAAGVEFDGSKKVLGENKAIYDNGAVVRFRVKSDPNVWHKVLAMRQSFNTASRFFEKGA